jgi:alkylated DNA repair dioxygenase AlkB
MAKVLQEGLVIIKNALSMDEQKKIAQLAVEIKDRFKPSAKNRVRIYDALTTYPQHDYLLKLADQWLKQAYHVDKSIIVLPPTHLLFLQYQGKSRLGYHSDDGQNDGKGLNPVVSLSIGNSCIFSVKHNREDDPENITLNSGDVIIFGGKCRRILHSVKVNQIHQNTVPDEINKIIGNSRLNLTFRYAPEILGREDEYSEFTYESMMRKRAEDEQ